MHKKFRLTTLALTQLAVTLLLTFVPAGMALAQTPQSAACQGVELTGGSCSGPAADKSVSDTIATVINIFSFIVGVTAVIMVIVGGFKYVISQGDSANTSSAKNTILYALIGLVVVALAQAIVQFVLKKL